MKTVYEFFSRDHGNQGFLAFTYISSLNFIRLPRVVITPSVTTLLRGENDSTQPDEIHANIHVYRP